MFFGLFAYLWCISTINANQANQWTGFYMIATSVMKESKRLVSTKRYLKKVEASAVELFIKYV